MIYQGRPNRRMVSKLGARADECISEILRRVLV